MSLPLSGAPESIAVSLATFYSKNEQNTSQRHFNTFESILESTAHFIGHACKLFLDGETGEAEEGLHTTRDRLTDALRKLDLQSGDTSCRQSQRHIRTSLLLARHNASIILKRDKTWALAGEVKKLRRTIATELYAHLQLDNDLYDAEQWNTGFHSRQRGAITELTCIALGIRQLKAKQLTTSALFHHDKGSYRTSNFDALHTETRSNGQAAFYRLQTKAGCLGLCDDPRKDDEELAKQCSLYNSNIRLLSGHCDFGFNYDDDGTDVEGVHFNLANLVVKEVFGKPTPEEITQLDAATDNMIFTIKYDEARRGTAGPAMSYTESITA